MKRRLRIAVSVAIAFVVTILNYVAVIYTVGGPSYIFNGGRLVPLLEVLIFPLCSLEGSGSQPVFLNSLLWGVTLGGASFFMLNGRSRFSLRTLLIATTAIAAVLGLAVWAWR